MAELVDALDLGSSIVRCGGSSPSWRTIKEFGLEKSCNTFKILSESSPNSMDGFSNFVPTALIAILSSICAYRPSARLLTPQCNPVRMTINCTTEKSASAKTKTLKTSNLKDCKMVAAHLRCIPRCRSTLHQKRFTFHREQCLRTCLLYLHQAMHERMAVQSPLKGALLLLLKIPR